TMLIHFGAPLSQENIYERGLSLAWHLRTETAGRGWPRWRLGMTAGTVYAGFVGGQFRDEYTALGTVVNLAARLMMGAEWGEILVAGEALVGEANFSLAALGERAYKGFTEPIETYQLTGWEETDTFFRHRLVGRDEEKQALHDFVSQIWEDRKGGAVVIYGEAGMGKSHLSFGLRQSLMMQYGSQIRWFMGQTDQILRQDWNPFVYWLRRYFGQAVTATAAENKEQFEWHFGRLLERLKEQAVADDLWMELERLKSFLGALVGLEWSGSWYERLGPQLRYQNKLAAIKKLLLAESYLQPVVFVLEDGQWLDEASLGMVSYLTQNWTGGAFVLLVTSRYADDGSKPPLPISDEMGMATIYLDSLSIEMVQEQATDILGGALADDFLATLREQSGSNPFFVQQLLIYFKERGGLRLGEDGRWEMGEDVAIPSSVNGVLVARIDRLADEVKRVVQTAAVLGREFDPHILGQMLQGDVVTAIEEGETMQIWALVAEMRYLFKHVLLREAAYEMQLREQLARLHRLAAESYERLYGDDLSAYYADLVYHYGRAKDKGKERHYAELAGLQAARRYANEAGITYLSRALALTSPLDTEGQYKLLLAREEIYYLIGEREAQLADLEMLSALAERRRRLDERLTVLQRRMRYAFFANEYERVVVLVGEVMALLEGKGDEWLEARAAAEMWWGKSLRRVGDYKGAGEHLRRARELAEGVHDLRLVNDILRIWVLYQLDMGGTYEDVQALIEEGQRITAESGDVVKEADWLDELGTSQVDITKQQVYYQQALALRMKIGDLYGQSVSFGNLGEVARLVGEYEQAREFYEKGARIDQQLGALVGRAIAYLNLGLIGIEVGDFHEAIDYAGRALKLCQRAKSRVFEAMAYYVWGAALGRQGLVAEGEAKFERSREILLAVGTEDVLLEIHVHHAHMLWVNGDKERAFFLLESEWPTLLDESFFDTFEEPGQICWLLYEMLVGRDDELAGQFLERGYKRIEQRLVGVTDSERRREIIGAVSWYRGVMKAWGERD
ncbi:MAG TPA: tetratricopeptide repeat protein, partial [Anaerolineae bacterium]|nr:tetratricopeptide repeat protein [Anaerolineae bacterium]